MGSLTRRQRTVVAGCVRAAAKENARFPLPAAELYALVKAVEDGTANDEEMEAAATIAAFAPMAQPDCSSRDWRVLTRALTHFGKDPADAHPYWRDIVQHHLSLGAYAK